MIGGGIFAVTGLTIQLTHGAAPLAFLAAGVVALLTAYSYWKLTVRYPSSGGTVEFLNRGFGSGIITGSLSILLCLSYVILLAVYAYAFGSYGVELFGGGRVTVHILATAILIALAVLNSLGPHLVIRSENAFNFLKMVILIGFIAAGLWFAPHYQRFTPSHWVSPVSLLAGAMVIFLNYEGFELIANAAPRCRNPARSLPRAYLASVSIVIVIYILIAFVVLGHLTQGQVAMHSDAVLSAAAGRLLPHAGSLLLAIAALVATSSAINATYYGSGRLTYLIAKYGELPLAFEHNIRNQPLEGMFLFALLSCIIVNVVPLNLIATMGSAGFLLIFAAVNFANLKLAKETHCNRFISLAGLCACVLAFSVLLWYTLSQPGNRWQVTILVAMIVVSLTIEWLYRRWTHRVVHMGHRQLES